MRMFYYRGLKEWTNEKGRIAFWGYGKTSIESCFVNSNGTDSLDAIDYQANIQVMHYIKKACVLERNILA